MSKLIYLAAPYSDPNPAVVEKRMEVFASVDGALLREGWITVSPLSKHYNLKTTKLPSDWAYWQTYSEELIKHCLAVFVIVTPGWKESVGVQGEIEYAKANGVTVMYVDEQGRRIKP